MQDYIYSIISVLAITIHLIINFDLITGRSIVSAHGARRPQGARECRGFLTSVFAFYLSDAAWGILAGLGWTWLLYADTVLYFIALAASAFMLARFVIVYLDFNKLAGRILLWFGYGLVALHVVALIANFFNNCFFYFDDQGLYVVGDRRYQIFAVMAVFNLLVVVFACIRAFRSHGPVRRRNIVVSTFCIIMMVAIPIQVRWPLLPFTALGYLLGSCLLRMFVIEDERDEMRKVIIEREQAKKHMEKLEKALERARTAEKARRMFFSIVSHDIRTPLNAILGYSELLRQGIKNQDEREEALDSIRSSGKTLLQLVNDVLDLAKIDSGKMTLHPEPLRLDQLTDDVFSSFRMAAFKKGVELVNKTGGIPMLMLDSRRFRQILFNLIGNAVKFTDKGSVTVTASYVGTNLEVAVSDTGCGIPPDMLTRVLDTFVQVQDPSHSADRAGGTGLGLSICRRLVELMGGELSVESELGKGSTFKARIPGVETDNAKPKPAVPPDHAIELKSLPKYVLVVDDSPVNRSVLTAFLKKAGVTSVVHACDGVEAFTQLDMAENAGRPHDLVFSDFWMPNMSGIELIEKLRADPRFASLPVYAVTADTECYHNPSTKLFTGVLLKPLTYGKLVGVLAGLG